MNPLTAVPNTLATRTAELRALLPAMLRDHIGDASRIADVTIRPSVCRSSFALDEVDLRLESGELVHLMLKDLDARALIDSARLAKPGFLYDPLREIEFYQKVLLHRPHLGTARLFGTVVEARRDRYWLLLERVAGTELHQLGDLAVWREVARWLAAFHTELRPLSTASATGVSRALSLDATYLRSWISRADAFARYRDGGLRGEMRSRMARLVSRYERVVERLTAMPATIIHGEFYPSNVLVEETGGSRRICPVDWEMLSRGPALLDVAALVAGRWPEPHRRDLALTYRDALAAGDTPVEDEEDFLEALAYCRLHFAVQWIGWSRDWEPPAEHAHDWLSEALALADTLDL